MMMMIYLETKSFKTVQAKFCMKFNINNHSQKCRMYRWIHNFQATGSVNNLNKTENPRLGRKLTARCPDNVDAASESAGRSPKKFIWRRSQELGLSRASSQRIWKKDLQRYPYKIQIKYKLTPANMEFLVSVIYHYHINPIYPTPPLGQDMTQGQFFSGV